MLVYCIKLQFNAVFLNVLISEDWKTNFKSKQNCCLLSYMLLSIIPICSIEKFYIFGFQIESQPGIFKITYLKIHFILSFFGGGSRQMYILEGCYKWVFVYNK